MISVPIVCILFLLVVFAYCRCRGRQKEPKEPEETRLIERIPPINTSDAPKHSPSLPESPINLDLIQLIDLLAKGRYGTVWRGTIDNQNYAVKTFSTTVRARGEPFADW